MHYFSDWVSPFWALNATTQHYATSSPAFFSLHSQFDLRRVTSFFLVNLQSMSFNPDFILILYQSSCFGFAFLGAKRDNSTLRYFQSRQLFFSLHSQFDMRRVTSSFLVNLQSTSFNPDFIPILYQSSCLGFAFLGAKRDNSTLRYFQSRFFFHFIVSLI